mgnify:CR=1 FL=1
MEDNKHVYSVVRRSNNDLFESYKNNFKAEFDAKSLLNKIAIDQEKQLTKLLRRRFLLKYKMPLMCSTQKGDLNINRHYDRNEYCYMGDVFLVIDREVSINSNLSFE